MPRMVITHDVVDIDRWLKGKLERAAAIGSAATNVTDYVALDGSNHVAVTADIDDLDAAQALLASPPPEVAAQMESHGVRPQPTHLHRPVCRRLPPPGRKNYRALASGRRPEGQRSIPHRLKPPLPAARGAERPN
jgi:hypothetical protein